MAASAQSPQQEEMESGAHGGTARPDFRDLFRDEYAYIRATARRLGIRERELPDLVHDVFVAVHRRLVDFEAYRPIRPWLFGITFRVVVGHKRRMAYRCEELSADEPDERADDAPRADEQIEDAERRRMVHEALEVLDDDKRAVFVLHEIDEVPMAEIAAALEIPKNTAYSRLRLGREEVRCALIRIVARRGRTS
jgi:RNA polymerase sigma-70 factor (ECF subfamily)